MAALHELRVGALDKVVLARTLRIPLAGHPRTHTVHALLTRLMLRDPQAHLFAATLPAGHDTGSPAPPSVLIGATPETLLARSGDRLTLTPLAGTAQRHPDPDIDRARAARLLASGKDREEHQYVIDALHSQLAPLCRTLSIPRTPSLHRTGNLWHLSTTIRARLAAPAPDALALALLLHPTPAVCGTPTRLARALISTLEPVPRRYYSGLVGWMDQAGDGQWDIALRCAELSATQLRLYAGAGITAQSKPEAELAKTQAKFATMLQALEDAFEE